MKHSQREGKQFFNAGTRIVSRNGFIFYAGNCLVPDDRESVFEIALWRQFMIWLDVPLHLY